MSDVVGTTGEANSPKEFKGRDGKFQRWAREIKLAEQDHKDWHKQVERTLKRYRDDRPERDQGVRRFNMLWSNVQTLGPAIYATPPKPVVERRFDDADRVGRAACQILQRGVQTQISMDDIHSSVIKARFDYLIGGRGTMWCRYHPEIVHHDAVDEERDENDVVLSEARDAYDQLVHESVLIDYVHWKDFLHSPARTWGEVDWVARRVMMTRDEGVKRFGQVFKDVPLDYDPRKDQGGEPEEQSFRHAVVWEIWCREDRKVRWLCPGYGERLLDEVDDPLQLSDFFPCPRPLYATLTTSTLIPIPDYVLYRDQAEQMDDLSNRRSLVTSAIAVRGVYNQANAGVGRLLQADENELIPIENWGQLAQVGGLKGSIDFLPIDMLSKVLAELTQTAEVLKQEAYEITGISDIIRGQSAASETATAQNIKSHFATLRLSDRQATVAEFCRGTIRLVAEIMGRHFSADSLLKFADYQQEQDANPAMALQAIKLIKDEIERGYRIDIETDSTIADDAEAQQASRLEFLDKSGQFIQQMLPLVQQVPAMGPLAGKMLLFGVRSFKAGRELESAFEDAISQLEKQSSAPPQPPADGKQMPPELVQADVQHKAAQTQAVTAKAQADVQATNADVGLKNQLTQVQIQNYQSQIAERQHKQHMAQQQHEQQLFAAQRAEARAGQQHEQDMQLKAESALAKTAALKTA